MPPQYSDNRVFLRVVHHEALSHPRDNVPRAVGPVHAVDTVADAGLRDGDNCERATEVAFFCDVPNDNSPIFRTRNELRRIRGEANRLNKPRVARLLLLLLLLLTHGLPRAKRSQMLAIAKTPHPHGFV